MQILANQELVSGKVVGSNLGTGKGFFPHKISVKVCLCIQLWILFHIVTYAWLVTNVSNFQTQFLKLFSNSFQELSTFSRQRKVKNIRTDLSKKKNQSFFSFCKKPIGGGFSQKKKLICMFFESESCLVITNERTARQKTQRLNFSRGPPQHRTNLANSKSLGMGENSFRSVRWLCHGKVSAIVIEICCTLDSVSKKVLG